MDAKERLAIAQTAMLEGDLGTARQIVAIVLASDPHHAGALELDRTLRAIETERAGIPAEALGDLRPDTRHLEDPVTFGDATRAPSTPIGVILLALWGIVLGAVVGVGGLVVIMAGFGIGLLLLLVGAFEVVSSIALWRLRPWGWYASVLLLPIAILANLFDASRGEVRGVVIAVLQVAALAYLVHVRGHFLARPARRGAPA